VDIKRNMDMELYEDSGIGTYKREIKKVIRIG
jgi:hypothetical protein